MPGKVTLKVTSGPLLGQVFAYTAHENLFFGRAHDCQARLAPDDKTASRYHFILEVNPPDARLRDLESLNGTFVNGEKFGGRGRGETPEPRGARRLPQIDLKHGDIVKVGDTTFEIEVEVLASEETLLSAGATDRVAPEPVRCGLCGRDVSSEVGERHGDYVCHLCQETAESDPATLLIEELLAHERVESALDPNGIAGYEVCSKLGEGGMGVVYFARNKRTGQPAAVKVMLAKVAVDEGSRQRFLREIETTKSLRHPHIVRLMGYGSVGSGFYFVLEFCPGGSVDILMERRGGSLPLAECGLITLQVLDGLSYAHSEGYIHRDIKPQNILLTSLDGGVAKVSDFGLAKSFQQAGLSGMTATGTIAGSVVFMSRDQLINFKYARPVSDVWSIGATLYFMLTGRPPREFPRGKDPVEVILHHDVIPIRQRDSGIPVRVAEVIDRSIADHVKDRYQTATEFREALAAVL